MKNKRLFNLWVWVAALVIAAISTGATFGYLFLVRPTAPADIAPASAAMTLIVASTSTPRDLPPTPTSIPPTLEATPTTLSGEFTIGAFVQVTEAGLRLRAAPGLNAQILFTGDAAEVFQISDGPQEADDYIWWYLVTPYDQNRSGWAVQDYLMVISAP